MTRMSTRTHGVLDFLTAGTLVALPRALGWGERVTSTLTKTSEYVRRTSVARSAPVRTMVPAGNETPM